MGLRSRADVTVHAATVAGSPSRSSACKAKPATEWRALVRDEITEGRRNDTIARIAGHLLRRYVDPHVVLELLLAWNATRCRPPLDRADVVLIVNSIAGKEIKRRSA